MAFRDLGIAHLKSKASPPSSVELGRGGSQHDLGRGGLRSLGRSVWAFAQRIAAEVWDTITTLAVGVAVLALLYALGLR